MLMHPYQAVHKTNKTFIFCFIYCSMLINLISTKLPQTMSHQSSWTTTRNTMAPRILSTVWVWVQIRFTSHLIRYKSFILEIFLQVRWPKWQCLMTD